MQPLTIDEMKNFEENEWIWLEKTSGTNDEINFKGYCQILVRFPKPVKGITDGPNDMTRDTCLYVAAAFQEKPFVLYYRDYGYGSGKTWIAYKNKELCCPHPICMFPECENQNYCPAIREEHVIKDTIKEAFGMVFDMAREQGKHPIQTPINWVENVKTVGRKFGVEVEE